MALITWSAAPCVVQGTRNLQEKVKTCYELTSVCECSPGSTSVCSERGKT